MKKIKRSIDPDNLLNPGKVLSLDAAVETRAERKPKQKKSKSKAKAKAKPKTATTEQSDKPVEKPKQEATKPTADGTTPKAAKQKAKAQVHEH